MIFNLFFRIGPAIQAIFGLGFEPKAEFFYELTPEQYRKLEEEGQDLTQKWYAILPKNPKYDIPELRIVNEDQKDALLDAVKYINNLCKKAEPERQFESFEDKLKYAASQLPSVFSQASDYEEKPSHLKVVK
jgi:hypothetical protein